MAEKDFSKIVDNLEEETQDAEKKEKSETKEETKRSVRLRLFLCLLTIAIVFLGLIITQIVFLSLR